MGLTWKMREARVVRGKWVTSKFADGRIIGLLNFLFCLLNSHYQDNGKRKLFIKHERDGDFVMITTREEAELEMQLANELNPGPWINHCKNVARAAEIIAKACKLDEDKAYILGLLHDIGKMDISLVDQKEMEHFISNHNYNDYDKLIILCDSLALPDRLCILEQRFVDTTIRYGVFPFTVLRWTATYDLKKYFESKMDCSLYDILPEIKELIK